VIYNGIDVDRFLQFSAEVRPLPLQKGLPHFELLIYGSMIPRKRVDVLLRGFAMVEAVFGGSFDSSGGGPLEVY